jgi:hypothetical protein
MLFYICYHAALLAIAVFSFFKLRHSGDLAHALYGSRWAFALL